MKGKRKMKNDTKELIRYIFVGGLTTLVNYSIYYVLCKFKVFKKEGVYCG